jgi:hypothetical protein
MRLALRPSEWEVRARAQDGTVQILYRDDSADWTRTFTREEIRDPRRLLEELGGPLAPLLLGALGGWSPGRDGSLGMPWEGGLAWLKVGSAQVRGYRLQARLLDRYEVVVVTSRVGEIMRVEFPGDLLLVNEVLTNL